MVAAPERTWVLAGGPEEPVLIYSLSGADIALAGALPAKNYKAMWFDPRTGATQDANAISGTSQSPVTKPDEGEWLLLLSPQ
jgi:hypothetical protein